MLLILQRGETSKNKNFWNGEQVVTAHPNKLSTNCAGTGYCKLVYLLYNFNRHSVFTPASNGNKRLTAELSQTNR